MNTQRTKPTHWSWEVMAAICSFSGGMAAGVIGGALTALTWILGVQRHPWLSGAGTALLIATIPLLIFSGYCLDWAERKSKKSVGPRRAAHGHRCD